MEVVEREYIPIAHCHHQNDSYIKMGSDESHFNVSLFVVGQIKPPDSPQTTTFVERHEPKREMERTKK